MKHISKFLSLVLRHQPDKINLKLDLNGWAEVDDLLNKMPFEITYNELKQLVDSNDKQRFTLNNTGCKIRANQGHSIKQIDLNFEPKLPPEILYHGTTHKFVSLIEKEGLKKMKRQHVHLSRTEETAIKVGSRRGVPVVLSIKALEMFKDGISFYKSKNGVWLTDHVPAKYIIFKA